MISVAMLQTLVDAAPDAWGAPHMTLPAPSGGWCCGVEFAGENDPAHLGAVMRGVIAEVGERQAQGWALYPVRNDYVALIVWGKV